MKVFILHDEITSASRPDEIDALHQADLVGGALRELGYAVEVLGVGLNLEALAAGLSRGAPDVVFNLVESLAGQARLLHVVPALLEARHIPFTGAGSGACLITTDKPLAKAWMHGNGVATPPWRQRGAPAVSDLSPPCRCIIKPVWEDASVGIDDGAVVAVSDYDELDEAMAGAARRFGEVFAERFVEGREFNLSLLADGDDVEALPVAEMTFVGYPEDKPRIVGYAAKWSEASFEYGATVRRFDLPDSDAPLVSRLRAMALAGWRLFGLRGYARVDFRVDVWNRPWVLEVNVNPCLSADAGFLAAAGRGGMTTEQVVARIVAAAHAAVVRKARITHA